MASILDKKVIKDDKNCLYFLIILIIINVWFFTAPAKRVTEMSLIANNIKYHFAQMTHDNTFEEYLYHRNNATYLVKLNNKQRTKHAIIEMDKAISTVPDYVSSGVIQSLYRDRAYVKLYAGDKKGALDDFLLAGDLNMVDNLKIAVLLTERSAFGLAAKHCQNILKEDRGAISGYICLSYVYEKAGKQSSALKIYNYAIATKKPANPKLYVERALFKKRINDIKGYNEDIAIAKNIAPNVDITTSITTEAINPKNLTFVVQ